MSPGMDELKPEESSTDLPSETERNGAFIMGKS